MTSKTQWSRPKGNAFIIPLGLIQRNALPQRDASSISNNRSNRTSTNVNANHTNGTPQDPPVTPRTQRTSYTNTSNGGFPVAVPTGSASPRKSSGFSSPQRQQSNESTSTSMSPSASADGGLPSEPSHSTVASNAVLRTPLSVVHEGSGSDMDVSDQAGKAGWWDKRKSLREAMMGKISPHGKAKERDFGELTDAEGELLSKSGCRATIAKSVLDPDSSVAPRANGTMDLRTC